VPLLIAALAAGAAAAIVLPAMAPGDAPPTTASFTAQDFAWNATGGTTHSVTIAEGGTVDFGYPSGASSHNADFSGGPAPSSCTQTAGVDSGPVPPLPAVPTASGWSGSCRFDVPGTYRFHCDLHPTLMTGTVAVVDPNAPPPPPTTTTTPTATRPRTPPPTTTTAPGGTTTPAPGGGGTGGTGPAGGEGAGSSGGGAANGRLHASVVRRQHGVVVRGTVTTPAARWRVVVTALASSRMLARHRPRRVHDVRIASQRGRSDATGVEPFALRLSASARAALHRRGRLAVKLRILATPPAGGAAARTTVAVVVRA
jgi:plastocyanin